MASTELEAKPLPDGVLPTELEVYQYFLHFVEVKIKYGERKRICKFVAPGISEQWDKSQIPHEV